MKFDAMCSKYQKMTTRCSSHDDLKQLKADIFRTGSDQVWGPMVNGVYDNAYFLTFVTEKIKKRAYAASFGRTQFDNSTIAMYKSMLTEYARLLFESKQP